MDLFRSDSHNKQEQQNEGLLSESLLGPEEKQVAVRFDDDNDEEQAAAADAAWMLTAPVDAASAAAVTGEVQPARWRDVWAVLLFLTKQGFIVYLAAQWGYPHLRMSVITDGDTVTVRYGAVLRLIAVVGSLALLVGLATLTVLTRVAKHLIQGSLLGATAANVGLAVFFFTQGSVAGGVFAVCMALWTAVYARAVWHRTALAASHLTTSLTAVRTHGKGILTVAAGTAVAMCLWFGIWMVAALGVYTRHVTSTDGTPHMSVAAAALLLLSLFWTTEVSRNIVHVTTAGTVGTWWFSPQDDATGAAVWDSWTRAVTFSLGSICLGSLLTAVFHLLHTLARTARRQGRSASMLLCVLECALRCTERLLTYFNKWCVCRGCFFNFWSQETMTWWLF